MANYVESDAVKKAQAMLQQQLASKPGAYQSQWQAQLNDTINKILNREKFSYDLNGDMLYQQYKDQYTTQGNMAMMDTMGQAQAMTGGYGNSYAQTAGQQTYQNHLQQLNDKIPELYSLALNKYNLDGQEMYNQYSMLGNQEAQDYGRYQDNLAKWQAELERLQNQYNTEREFDYGKYADDRNYQYQTSRDQVADSQWQKEFNEAQRQFNQNYSLSASKASSSGSSSSSKSSSSTGSSKTGNNGSIDITAAYGNKLTYSDVANTAAQMRAKGASPNDIYQYISAIVNGPKYKPTTSVKQDLAELKSAYVGSGR